MNTGTLDIAARAFGSLIATHAGRTAVASLGLSGANAPVFRCALYNTTVGEVATELPTTVLVIDVERNRIATLTIPGNGGDDGSHVEVQLDHKLGCLVDRLQAEQRDPSDKDLGGIRCAIVELAA